MAPEISLRASRMPLAFTCPGSTIPPAIPISESSEEAALGIATHEALRSLAERGDVVWHDIPRIATAHGAKADDVLMLCRMARNLWPSLAESFRDCLTEVPLKAELGGGITLTGHADLLSIRDNVARAADWKTGRADSDYSAQMRAYGALVMLENPDLAEVTITIIWIRAGEIENYTMHRLHVVEWLRELQARVLQWDGVYHPGKHCGYCPRSHECAAHNALVRRDVAAMTDVELGERIESTLATMRPDAIVDLLRKADSVSDVATRVRAAIKAHVVARGDIIADGTRLTIETQQRREVVADRAWPLLEDAGFESKDFAAAVDFRIGALEKVVATKAGRGKGAAAVRALMAQMEAAGALQLKEQPILKAKRI